MKIKDSPRRHEDHEEKRFEYFALPVHRRDRYGIFSTRARERNEHRLALLRVLRVFVV